MLTPDQYSALLNMRSNSGYENTSPLPPEVARPLERGGFIQFVRVTPYAQVTVYRLTEKGRHEIEGC